MEWEKVRIECPCPGSPHPDGDEVGLHPKLGLKAGVMLQRRVVTAQREARESQEPDMVEAALVADLSELYCLVGIGWWTLVDEDGDPLPVSEEAIREHILADFSRAAPVADRADALYLAPVILPLVGGASTSSQPGPTNGSTSATKTTTRTPRKRSRSSSTSTSQTGVTVATSA